jgi:hypothetical protein
MSKDDISGLTAPEAYELGRWDERRSTGNTQDDPAKETPRWRALLARVDALEKRLTAIEGQLDALVPNTEQQAAKDRAVVVAARELLAHWDTPFSRKNEYAVALRDALAPSQEGEK